MKAVWKGSISFALVNIPVKLYTATRKEGVGFHMMHQKCGTLLHYDRHCDTCKVTVPWEDVTHGYEYEKVHYVLVSDEEIEALPAAASKRIDILRFVDPGDIDPLHYDRPYYVEPVEGGERAYALLREIMHRTGKVPLAKLVMREREHLAVLIFHEDALALHTLLYAGEVLAPSSLNIPNKVKLEKQEVDIGLELVRRFSGGLDIGQYRDEHREALMELIEAKIRGREVKIPPTREARKVVSLMDALKKSIKAPQKEKAAARKKRA